MTGALASVRGRTTGRMRRALALVVVPVVLQALAFQANVWLGVYDPTRYDCISPGDGWTMSTYCDYGFFGPMFAVDLGAVFMFWTGVVVGVSLAAGYLATSYALEWRRSRTAPEVAHGD